MGDFTPLNEVGNYIVSNLQALGWIIAGIVTAILGIVLVTSGGNEQRVGFVKQAAIYLVVGVLVLVGVSWLVNLLQSISAPLAN